jgi:2,3-bisphosphoglycerate-dependent phosphoglycerate mutase
MEKRKKCKIFLFRHGQTFYNKNKYFTGWKDSKLTPEGFKNARKIAELLKNEEISIAIHTRLTRSKKTLREVLKFHPECKIKIKDDRMIERSYGDLQGMSHKKFIENIGKKFYDLLKEGDAIDDLDSESNEEIKKYLGTTEFNLIHRGYDIPPPNGESLKMVEKRVGEFILDLKKLVKKHKKNIAISAHGNSIRVFRKIMEEATIDEMTGWFIPYDKVFVYEFEI